MPKQPKIIDYDTMYDKTTGNTENHLAADTVIEQRNALQDNKSSGQDNSSLQDAYEEGFGSASGVRGETSETGGRIRHPERGDKARPSASSDSIDRENTGLADN